MEKLIAKRPIRYMGRTYERGAPLPAQDPKMVAAWLKAGSAAWVGDTKEAVAATVRETDRRSRMNDMAAEAIRAMGVAIEDAAGEFVGAASIEEQLRAIFAGDHESVADGGHGEGGQEAATVTGHLDAADLENWKKADLEKLAADRGVDISKARNNAERAAILAAVEVQAHAGEDGNVPLEPDAEDSEV